ncbi:MAG: SUMF1/EgtB/PvdO family nonheme iron enzyme [Saprospiraceae bacterium]|nr:SUMF1/EgtB/PvdO family nonheme iron enzyme [Saprospiraceae bacterium]
MQTIFSLLPIRQYCRLLAILGVLLGATNTCQGQKLDEQCQDCPCLIRLAKGKAERQLYSEAIRLYNAARTCDPTQAQQIDARVAAIFQTISNLRDEAERQRRIADKAANEAEQAGLKLLDAVARAEKETQIAKSEKTRADSLAEVIAKQLDAVQQQRDSMQLLIQTTLHNYCNSVEKLIYELNYNVAEVLLLEALKLDAARSSSSFSPKDTLSQRVRALALELIYCHLQIDSLDQTAPLSSFFKDFHGAETPTQLENTIAHLDSALYAHLEARYFPKTVRIDASFSIGQTEVTFWQYALFAASDKRELVQPPWGLQGDHPAVGVSWWDAVDYCTWLNGKRTKSGEGPAVYKHKKSEIESNSSFGSFGLLIDVLYLRRSVRVNKQAAGYRLPFKREWEKAAGNRNSTSQRSPVDMGFSQHAQINQTKAGFKTHAVGETRPNALQLFDMGGNAREWIWRTEKKSKVRMNMVPIWYRKQVVKGAFWYYEPVEWNASAGILMKATAQSEKNGFRVVLSHGRQ